MIGFKTRDSSFTTMGDAYQWSEKLAKVLTESERRQYDRYWNRVNPHLTSSIDVEVLRQLGSDSAWSLTHLDKMLDWVQVLG